MVLEVILVFQGGLLIWRVLMVLEVVLVVLVVLEVVLQLLLLQLLLLQLLPLQLRVLLKLPSPLGGLFIYTVLMVLDVILVLVLELAVV